MKKAFFIFLFCIILTFSAILCGLSGGMAVSSKSPIQQTDDNSKVNADENSTFSTVSKEPFTLDVGSAKIIALTKSEENSLVEWKSSNESVVTVDDGGRVDGVSQGSADVTATFSNKNIYKCTITVTNATASEYDGFSTCEIANTDIVEKNKQSESTLNLYYIKVNRQENCVTVYTYDDNGEYTVPVRAMVCSCGENNGTITGDDFGIYFQNEWHALFGDVYGHYVSGISGDYLFHSVPYFTMSDPSSLEVDEFNKLGTSASMGCVRMATADVKWVFENCPMDTGVTIYDDDNPGPLGKPNTISIADLSCGWDPTDDNDENPYKTKKPEIKGATDCTVAKAGKFYPLNGVTAVDTCSNDITDDIRVIGNVVTSKAGTYKVSYYVKDNLRRSAQKDIYVTVA